jgi:hypothetical protein
MTPHWKVTNMNPGEMIHENKTIRVVMDLSGKRSFSTEMTGTLTMDADPDIFLDGEPHISVTADCGDILLVGALRTAAFAADLPKLKKGASVRLGGLFSPTGFEREGDSDILKPFSGFMVVTKLTVNPPTE